MGKVSFNEALKSDRSAYQFTLKNDGDYATVKFLFDAMNDLDNFTAYMHNVRYKGKWYRVSCLEGEDERGCPLCDKSSENKDLHSTIKVYLPLYNLTEDTFQYWERGKTFVRKIRQLCSEYYPLSDEVFEIERDGEKGNRDTDYKISEITDEYVNRRGAKSLDFKFSDLDVPDCLDEEAGMVLEKSYEELQYYAEHGVFEDDDYDYSRFDSNNTAARFNSRNRFDNDSSFRSRNNEYHTRKREISNEEDDAPFDMEDEKPSSGRRERAF